MSQVGTGAVEAAAPPNRFPAARRGLRRLRGNESILLAAALLALAAGFSVASPHFLSVAKGATSCCRFR